MKLGIVINDIQTEIPTAATLVMIRAAVERGHEVYAIAVGDLSYSTGGSLRALARRSVGGPVESQQDLLEWLQSDEVPVETIDCGDLDVLYLRYNPGEDERAPLWQQDAGIAFGQVAVHNGTFVLNDPYGLAHAVNKIYLEHFPETVRPKSVITRRLDEVKRFHEAQGGRIVVKPLRGYGGRDVYLIQDDTTNLPQIVESITRSTYLIAQEFMPEASEGDVRLFLVNGRPLQVDGKYAALRRRNDTGDFRSNLSAGGMPHHTEVTDKMLELAEAIGPRIREDGLFFVGIDIVGDKIVEINSISAGGINSAGELQGVDFGAGVIEAIERKVEHRRGEGARLSNRELAVWE